jgi:hypothetical protein
MSVGARSVHGMGCEELRGKQAGRRGSEAHPPGSSIGPIIVCVFPEPVCPYAKMQLLNPWNALSSKCFPSASYTISCTPHRYEWKAR